MTELDWVGLGWAGLGWDGMDREIPGIDCNLTTLHFLIPPPPFRSHKLSAARPGRPREQGPSHRTSVSRAARPLGVWGKLNDDGERMKAFV